MRTGHIAQLRSRNRGQRPRLQQRKHGPPQEVNANRFQCRRHMPIRSRLTKGRDPHRLITERSLSLKSAHQIQQLYQHTGTPVIRLTHHCARETRGTHGMHITVAMIGPRTMHTTAPELRRAGKATITLQTLCITAQTMTRESTITRVPTVMTDL